MSPVHDNSAPDFLTEDEAKQEADSTQWRTVSEEEQDEEKVSFDNVGDEFIGTYLGYRQVENENGKFTQYRFQDGELYYFINGNWALMRAMANVSKGARTRIIYAGDKDTGQETPMKLFKVMVAAKPVKKSGSTGRPTRQSRRVYPQ